jgi:hypothetical protein
VWSSFHEVSSRATSLSKNVSRRSGRYTFDRFRPIKVQDATRGSTTNRDEKARKRKVTGLLLGVGCRYKYTVVLLIYLYLRAMKSWFKNIQEKHMC